ncbi:protein phosphatase 2C and cyclic nucleotide-binding/kinase domain-containing protein-like [Salvia splendens]|uniref:protein phosphatase 2C and cyclic nucleotide-binding/kinase domain-containing protein-like n=1 Tax=Salvia splendens TaxID=180675 RepID=UPI00110392CF|nr:protein phosphatase 2C and cyclic nucleotide-binding/kinase domain-containing protein-like [Salvia splendens]
MGCVYSKAWTSEFCAPGDVKLLESGAVKTGEKGDQLYQFSSATDHEAGIARLSAQFLPPADGLKVVKVPSGEYELHYSFLSLRGHYPDALDKANQDSFCTHTPFGTSPDDHFFGVFDGHGEFGAQCSQFVKQSLCENLLRNSRFHTDAVEACHAAFLTTNSQLHSDIVDDSMSGTTAVTILVRGRKLYIANAGDSRAVVGEKRGNDVVAVDLSIDQTPFRPDELERVKLCGARVLTLDQIEGLKNPHVRCWGTEEYDDDGDPPRLWVQDGMYPGTAFTRSIGDSIAVTIGVVANPEIVVLELTQSHPFFVIASDGVFEFLSSQTVVDMVAKHKDPRDACAEIVAESYRRWLQHEARTDDITVIVAHVNGLKDAAFGQSADSRPVLRPSLPQVVASGSESPSRMNWRSRNQRARHDISRARLHALENSLENGQNWIPSSPSHGKTWEDEAQIEQALRDHFLFRKLTNSQCQVLLECMQRIEVGAGDIVMKQGGEGDCFYVVGDGEFEVLATQEEKDGNATRVLQRYTAEKLSSFGELALMYNKPLQASVQAVTNGTLWALKREDFRGILMSKFSNLSSLKLLRSVDLLARLTILQLSNIADSLLEVSFCDGQKIVDKNEDLLGLYVIQKGVIKITCECEVDLLQSVSLSSLIGPKQDDGVSVKSFEKNEGSYFGEWTLLGEHITSLSAIAVGDVVCSIVTKEKFDSVVGESVRSPLRELPKAN